ncbi:TIGR02270 family protein [Sorangium sp. So ce426]|uniref:TIGR02270 family protein n=1 Tax=Sorangium sp. So ce426 TaxID=3133312 RepID=UPI003F5BE961
MAPISLPDVLETHADAAMFLRAQRSRAARSRTHGLAQLAPLDERLEAHLDGLLLAAEGGDDAAGAARRAGGRFVEAFLAIRLRSAPLLRDAAERAGLGPGVAGGERDVVAALGWAPWSDADAVTAEPAGGRADAPLALLRLHAQRAHRRDPGDALPRATLAGDPRLRAAALRAAGELCRRDLTGALRDALDDPDAGCRAWAAWSGALLGDPRCRRALPALARAGEAELAERALELAVRVLPPGEAEALIREIAAAGGERRALAAAAAWGDARAVPWILALADRPDLARLAGWAFSAITGVDVARGELAAVPPPGFRAGPTDDPWERDVGMDPDARLAWPDAGKLRARWADLAGRFDQGARHRLGRPIDRAALHDALFDPAHAARVPQALRAGAALDLAALEPGRALFEVRGPSFRQARALRPAGRPDEAPRVAAR